MAKYPCIESRLDCEIQGITVRLWINQEEIPLDYKREKEILRAMARMPWFGPTTDEILNWVLNNVENLNAVEVRAGPVGTVVYTRAFSEGEDVHG